MGYKVAVVGATGNVGREMLAILAERTFPADEVVALASRRSLGAEVSFGDKILKIRALEHCDFTDVDICLMSAGSAVAKEWAPKIAAAGAVVIDNSSCWRYDSDVPLIVPEVNADVLARERAERIRVVAANELWTAFVPAAARWPFEVHLYPHRRVADIPALSQAEREAFATLYQDVLRRFDRLFGIPMPYISAWHQAPVHVDRDLAYLHLQLFSSRRAADRLKYLAGSESAMGAFINDVRPEEAARLLRET